MLAMFDNILYYTVPYCTIQYRTVPSSTIQHCAVMYCCWYASIVCDVTEPVLEVMVDLKTTVSFIQFQLETTLFLICVSSSGGFLEGEGPCMHFLCV